jgi:lipopolysaccharide/colanic/teichoic acid biosynthesis glycosyltransferase
MLKRDHLGYRTTKRTLDIVLSALALTVLAVPLAVIALAVWWQDRSAPIFFRQRRTGLGGKSVHIMKFRTMVQNADELKSNSATRASCRGPTSGWSTTPG